MANGAGTIDRKNPNRMGAPQKLTPELQEKIVAFIRAGGYIETAAKAAGISKNSLYNWFDLANKKKSKIHVDFLRACEKAMSESEMIDVANISRAANKGQWQASAWRLERKFPNRWGRMDRTEVNHTGAVLTLNYLVEKKVEDNVAKETEPADTDILRS